MLSKINLLLLGIIAERPINPYEVTKLLDAIQIRKWFPVAESSVYASIKGLHTKGYIAGKVQKDGKMPEKAVYSITDKGQKAFQQSLLDYLESTDHDVHQLDIAIMLICHIEKSKALDMLQCKLEKLRKSSFVIKQDIEYIQSTHPVPATGLAVMNHHLNVIEAEIKTLANLKDNLIMDTNWNYFLTNLMK